MTHIDVSNNNLSIEGKTALGKILEEIINLRCMTCDEWSISLEATDLDLSDLSSKQLDLGDARAIASVVKRHRALSSLKLNLGVAMTAGMTTADFSGKDLGAFGATLVAAFLPKCP